MNEIAIKGRQSFENIFTSILSTMVDLHGNFGMYQHAIGDDNKKIYVHLCNDIRQKLIDFIGEVSMEYQCEMKDTIRDLLIGSGELEDIAATGYMDYQHYTLEDFLNEIINEAYQMHNKIVMDTWMTMHGVHISKLIN